MHDAAHATAIGKSILAQLDDAGRDDYFSRHPLHDLTPRTVVDRRRLRLPDGEGLAVDDGEYALGVCCLAAPLAIPGAVGSLGVVAAPGAGANPTVRTALRNGASRVARALAVH